MATLTGDATFINFPEKDISILKRSITHILEIEDSYTISIFYNITDVTHMSLPDFTAYSTFTEMSEDLWLNINK